MASHIQEIKEKEHKEGQRAGQSIQPKKVTIEVLSDTLIKLGLNKMMSTKKVYENCLIWHIIWCNVLQGKGDLILTLKI